MTFVGMPMRPEVLAPAPASILEAWSGLACRQQVDDNNNNDDDDNDNDNDDDNDDDNANDSDNDHDSDNDNDSDYHYQGRQDTCLQISS